jgi:hypothetical protein
MYKRHCLRCGCLYDAAGCSKLGPIVMCSDCLGSHSLAPLAGKAVWDENTDSAKTASGTLEAVRRGCKMPITDPGVLPATGKAWVEGPCGVSWGVTNKGGGFCGIKKEVLGKI